MIIFQNVSKYYDNQTVLKNITFTVQKGEITFITGPSGAGKSTLLKLMYLAESPDEGDIVIGDFHLASLKEAQIPYLRRSVGVVFQDFKLINSITVFDNVALSLRIRGMKEREIRDIVSNALKKVHIRHLSDSYPTSLSGGEQQRVVIARAIAAEPLVILADEPTGNLDPNTSIDIIRVLRELNAQGATILIATHNRELFRGTGNRVLKLDGGNIVGEEAG
ncbi:MAG TPA: cell division ATP-binding protein FtsE [Nitrospiraceae bacterium]|nr:MAG: cell division ATP-binding protein FtsE [Nitrospirae bacterium GWA2_46_11]HCZ11944.1 cell division ATP-binding protein FtsE [Nitrospiraceae bacterium]